MNWVFFIVALVILIQLGLLIYGRRVRRAMKDSVIERYNLKSPKDAWLALGDNTIPKEDKDKIKALYENEE